MTHTPSYKNPQLPILERVQDLLSKMTIEEKVGEMMQLDGRDDAIRYYKKMKPGSYLQILDNMTVELQQLAIKSRLGIPLLFGIDAIHGHSFYRGATIFPTQLALACSWDPLLAEQMGKVTAKEMNGTGVHLTFSPVLCMARDLRWGRVDETFGEDQLLIGDLACALIKGYQGANLSDPDSILACAKHYAAYSETQGGRDATEAEMSKRKVESFFLPAFQHAARNKVASFMIAYQAIDGVPCTANKWLITKKLKEEWGFEGFTLTDYQNLTHLINYQQVASDIVSAVEMAVHAGTDMFMASPEFYGGALEALRQGRISEEQIDASCERILATKFKFGLFENPRFPVPERERVHIGCREHRDTALKAARESIVLLKNKGILPLDLNKIRKVAVVGPNADAPLAQLGDWTLGSGQAGKDGSEHPRELVTTVLDGVKMSCSGLTHSIEIGYARGCSCESDDTGGIPEAVGITRNSDVCIAVVGDDIFAVGEWNKGTAKLELLGGQQKLLEQLKATGKPLVVILINSKPLSIPWIEEQADAIIEAFNPGMFGGQAIGEILSGKINPCGKLPISFPRHVGQQPVWYNQLPGQHGFTYCDLDQSPLFAFGEGLSYTEFRYSNLKLHTPVLFRNEPLKISIDITNCGVRDGVEISQLYINDKVTSRTWPHKMLKGYRKTFLPAKATATIYFSINYNDLALFTCNDIWEVEPGDFEVMIGGSSRDKDLLRADFKVVY